MRQYNKIMIACLLATALSACESTLDKLEGVGKPPPHTAADDPTRHPDYEPISWPLPKQTSPDHYSNSLWQPGSRSFFRDQRAGRVGDILKVTMNINDKILSDNEGEGKRQLTDNSQMPALAGLEGKLSKILGRNGNPASLTNLTSDHDLKSTGKITRQDQIKTQVAALVTQVLPNGNLVIDGKEEIQMNYEIREIAIKGVVRREDITPDNTVDSSQVAEARITYGGRGQLMEMQQPRWGDQVLDIVAPF